MLIVRTNIPSGKPEKTERVISFARNFTDVSFGSNRVLQGKRKKRKKRYNLFYE